VVTAMDESVRKLLEDAYRQDDEARAASERRQWQREREHVEKAVGKFWADL
jgi:hypothetical protein